MGDTEHINIVRHVELHEIVDAIKSLDVSVSKADVRLRKRLRFVRLRYKGYSVAQAADIIGINHQSGYNWQKMWNEGGFAALVPGFSGGRTPKITDEQKSCLLKEIEKRPMTTREAIRFVRDRFHVTYSEKQVHVILAKLGLRHAKPCQDDCLQPKDSKGHTEKTSLMVWLV
ncbi:MAG: helix-turn-helix domain-containing protein [Candidatus Methanoplasma sp.]|jgi:putative transposase|nr:helix-turn-helix domain-containing protein [Candidatus Methanoplasma sp.]